MYREASHVSIQEMLSGVYRGPGSVPGPEDAELKEQGASHTRGGVGSTEPQRRGPGSRQYAAKSGRMLHRKRLDLPRGSRSRQGRSSSISIKGHS